MNKELTWTATEDIAIALADKFPDTGFSFGTISAP